MSYSGQDVETQGDKSRIGTLDPVTHKEAKILIVDDDSEDVLYLTEVLEESFDESTEVLIDKAANFEEAMQKVVDNHYNLVLLDYKLGYLNGLEVQKTIKQEKPSLPIVFVTGQGNEKTAVEAIKQGALDYLVKDDLNTTALKAILGKVFQNTSSNLPKQTKDLFMSLANKGKENSVHFFIQFDKSIKLNVKEAAAKFTGSNTMNFFMEVDKWLCRV